MMSDYTGGGYSDDDRVSEWEVGLPNVSDLTPLSQALIPHELASAFSITAEAYRSNLDVGRASQKTMSCIKGQYKKKKNDLDSGKVEREMARKRGRLVWTAQLHKRFVEVVGHLGMKNAVPKRIMEMMNVEGLSRENVASHLQKYRLRMSSEGSSSVYHHLLRHGMYHGLAWE